MASASSHAQTNSAVQCSGYLSTSESELAVFKDLLRLGVEKKLITNESLSDLLASSVPTVPRILSKDLVVAGTLSRALQDSVAYFEKNPEQWASAKEGVKKTLIELNSQSIEQLHAESETGIIPWISIKKTIDPKSVMEKFALESSNGDGNGLPILLDQDQVLMYHSPVFGGPTLFKSNGDEVFDWNKSSKFAKESGQISSRLSFLEKGNEILIIFSSDKKIGKRSKQSILEIVHLDKSGNLHKQSAFDLNASETLVLATLDSNRNLVFITSQQVFGKKRGHINLKIKRLNHLNKLETINTIDVFKFLIGPYKRLNENILELRLDPYVRARGPGPELQQIAFVNLDTGALIHREVAKTPLYKLESLGFMPNQSDVVLLQAVQIKRGKIAKVEIREIDLKNNSAGNWTVVPDQQRPAHVSEWDQSVKFEDNSGTNWKFVLNESKLKNGPLIMKNESTNEVVSLADYSMLANPKHAIGNAKIKLYPVSESNDSPMVLLYVMYNFHVDRRRPTVHLISLFERPGGVK